MRAKQPATQLPPSSLAMTILPSAANDRGRKSRAVAEPAAVAPPAPPAPASEPEPAPAPMEFAGAPAATAPTAAPAPDWAPPPAPPAAWAPPAPSAAPPAPPAPDWASPVTPAAWAPPPAAAAPTAPSWTPPPQTWAPPSTSRFGNPPADYQVNYSAAPGFPPQPSYTASSGVDYLPPAAPGQPAPGQWVPQHAAGHHGSTQAPPAYGPPAFGAPGYSGYQGYPPAPPQRSTASKVWIGVAIALVAIVAIGVAIPVVISQRKPVPVTLVLPQSLQGSTKLDSPAFQQLDSTVESTVFKDTTVFTDPQAAFWGNPTPTFGVMTAKLVHRPTASEASDYWAGASRGGTQDGVTLTKVPPGALGGTTECGVATGEDIPFIVCLSLDNSAAVYIIVYTSDLVQGTLTAQQLREAVELH